MKLLWLIPLLVITASTIAWATPIENQELSGTSSNVNLEIKFGDDSIRTLPNGIQKADATLEYATMEFYGDTIDLRDSDIRVSMSGNHFRISNVELGLIMYGQFQPGPDNYKINVYFAGPEGFKKYPVTTAFSVPDEKVAETEVKEKTTYIPELTITTEHDFRSYWQDTFDIQVNTYDKNKNKLPELYPFEGKLDNVNVTVILSLDDKILTTMKGITENGIWNGNYFLTENITPPGEYVIDVLAEFDGQTDSKTSTTIIIGEVPRKDS